MTEWEVTLSQGSWSGTITSQHPQQTLQTPGLSGQFDVTVVGAGPKMKRQKLSVQSGSQPNIGCNSTCAAMVGIVANADGTSASYWTVWDAICRMT